MSDSTDGDFAPSDPHAHQRERSGRPLKCLRILVVEDEFFIGLELCAFLETLGATVLGPFASTRAARAALGDGCDGAVLDVNLGRETSIPLARDLVKAGSPILFVTAHADDNGLFAEGLSGAPRLGKPVSRAILKRRVIELFGPSAGSAC